VNAWDDLSDKARWYLENFDELALAEMLAGASNQHEKVTAGTPLVCSDERHDAKVAALEAALDGAYRERAQITAWLAALHPAVLAPASDVDESGWQILYVYAGGQQLSWHIHPRDADLYAHVQQVTAEDPRARWDGHTTEQKYDAIRQMCEDAASRCGPACGEQHTYADGCEVKLTARYLGPAVPRCQSCGDAEHRAMSCEEAEQARRPWRDLLADACKRAIECEHTDPNRIGVRLPNSDAQP
jgi:hypothetical protein